MNMRKRKKHEPSTPPHVYEVARKLRSEQTPTEKKLWDALKNRQLNGLKFRRQHPIGGYVVDFYCPEKKLVIEIDGEIHNDPDRKDYDWVREQELTSQGVKIIRFTTKEIEDKLEDVLEDINNSALN